MVTCSTFTQKEDKKNENHDSKHCDKSQKDDKKKNRPRKSATFGGSRQPLYPSFCLLFLVFERNRFECRTNRRGDRFACVPHFVGYIVRCNRRCGDFLRHNADNFHGIAQGLRCKDCSLAHQKQRYSIQRLQRYRRRYFQHYFGRVFGGFGCQNHNEPSANVANRVVNRRVGNSFGNDDRRQGVYEKIAISNSKDFVMFVARVLAIFNKDERKIRKNKRKQRRKSTKTNSKRTKIEITLCKHQ